MTPVKSIGLHVGGVAMEISSDVACLPSLERIELAWASAMGTSAEPPLGQAEVRVHFDEDAEQVVVEAGPLVERDEFELPEAHLAIERGIYAELERVLPQAEQMIHAGAVLLEGHGFVFLGPSGAGKSSLCLAAVQDGATYLSDDVLTTNGTFIRGVARAIQFDPPERDREFPKWLRKAPLDFEIYPRHPKVEDSDNSTPLLVPGPHRTLSSARANSVSVVVLSRGVTERLSPLSRVAALGKLVESSFRRSSPVDLGSLLSREAFELSWSEPNRAWQMLRESQK